MFLKTLLFLSLLFSLFAFKNYSFNFIGRANGTERILKFTHFDKHHFHSMQCISDYFGYNNVYGVPAHRTLLFINATPEARILRNHFTKIGHHHKIAPIISMDSLSLFEKWNASSSYQYINLMNIVYFITSLKDIQTIGLSDIKRYEINQNQIHIICVNSRRKKYSDVEFEKQVRFAFRSFVLRFGVHLVLIVQKHLSLDDYAWQVYQQVFDNCNRWHMNIQIVHKCLFNSDKAIIKSFQMPSHTHRCSLKILTKIMSPFTIYNKHNGFSGGIEIFLLNTIGQKLNAELDFVPVEMFEDGAAVQMNEINEDKY